LRRAVVLAIASLFIFVSVAQAATTTFTATSGTWKAHFYHDFAVATSGTVTVAGDFTPKSNGKYRLSVGALDFPGYGCEALAQNSQAHIECSFTAAAGDYRLNFWAVSGPAVQVEYTVTTP